MNQKNLLQNNTKSCLAVGQIGIALQLANVQQGSYGTDLSRYSQMTGIVRCLGSEEKRFEPPRCQDGFWRRPHRK